jgi:hypothetical protein
MTSTRLSRATWMLIADEAVSGCFGTVLLGLRLGRLLSSEQDMVTEARARAAEPALT